ncbi:MAG: CGLD23 protein required for cyt b6 assembly [Monoraphidium minutum]|nr:MAG: CGLD23 protein required for cyt b6 assembly [Monoraphidium minutum]
MTSRCFSHRSVVLRSGAPSPRLQAHIGSSRLQRTRVGRSAVANDEVPDVSYDIVAQNQGLIRGLPLWGGAIGFAGLLANRAISGIAPVVDASSSQSRADVLGIAMSAVLLLTGLQWLSLKPRPVEAAPQVGEAAAYLDPKAKLPEAAAREMQWAWEALSSTARVTSLVVIYQGRNVAHFGLARPGHALGSARLGDVASKAMADEKGNYLANLILYPGRVEFVQYLPETTQGVVVQPIGTQGVLVVGSDTSRGISRLDQAWIATVADKLEVSLEGYTAPQGGVGFGGGKGGGKA